MRIVGVIRAASGGWTPAALAPRAGLAAVLLVFLAVMLSAVSEKSATADEPLHATGGYTYWKFNDYRIQQENSGNGILPQRWFALPLLTRDYPFPPATSPAWREGNGFLLGDQWFHRMGNNALEMLTRGRVAAAFMPMLLAALVWHCSRQRFGTGAAWLSLLVCVLNPAVLGNGPLMTSDVCAALFFLASVWTWWSLLNRFTSARLILSALATAGVFLSKMSAPVVIPCLVLLAVARIIDGRPFEIGTRTLGRTGQLVLVGALTVFQAAVVYVAIWGAYGFRYALAPDAQSQSTPAPALWDSLLQKSLVDAVDELSLPAPTKRNVRDAVERYVVSADESDEAKAEVLAHIKGTLLTPEQGLRLDARLAAPDFLSLPTNAILWARANKALPEGYLLAYLHMWRNSRGRRGFLDGEFSIYGNPSYFPYMFLVKTPLPTLALLGLAAGATLWRRRQAGPGRDWRETWYATVPLWVLIVVYLAVGLVTRLNIGHRHLLPIYPPLFVLCGAAAAWVAALRSAPGLRVARGAKIAGVSVLLLIGVQAAEVAYRYPHYLAYFNGILTPGEAYRHVADSSIDWGQDLPGVRRHIDARPDAAPFYLSYFGAGDPATYGIQARYLPSTPGLFMIDRPALRWEPLPPASATAAAAASSAAPVGYEVVGVDAIGAAPGRLLMKTREALQLTAGTYFISATMLQTPWDARAEKTYQKLRGIIEPFLQSDVETRHANIVRLGADRWQAALQSWEVARFARLTAFLRSRTPDANIGYSILVYRLSAADLARALETPAASGS